MSKTIKDLFTDAEWDLLVAEYVPQLGLIASLPVPDDPVKKESGDET